MNSTCRTCRFFETALSMGKALGKCHDPTKVIRDSTGSEVRSKVKGPLEVYHWYICDNYAKNLKGRSWDWSEDGRPKDTSNSPDQLTDDPS